MFISIYHYLSTDCLHIYLKWLNTFTTDHESGITMTSLSDTNVSSVLCFMKEPNFEWKLLGLLMLSGIKSK